MPSWLASLLFAVLVVTIPFTLILTIMQRLPKAVVLSHRRWPLPLKYIVTTGRTGLSLRKTVYRNIIDVEEISRNRAETTLLIATNHGMAIRLTLPTRSVPVFYDQLKPQL